MILGIIENRQSDIDGSHTTGRQQAGLSQFNFGKYPFAISDGRIFAPGVRIQSFAEWGSERRFRFFHTTEAEANGSIDQGIGHNSSCAALRIVSCGLFGTRRKHIHSEKDEAARLDALAWWGGAWCARYLAR